MERRILNLNSRLSSLIGYNNDLTIALNAMEKINKVHSPEKKLYPAITALRNRRIGVLKRILSANTKIAEIQKSCKHNYEFYESTTQYGDMYSCTRCGLITHD